jgi:mRNA interferase RelE/StbE
MENYRILFRNSAAKELRGIPEAILKKIWDRIEALARDPRPHGSEKLAGRDHYRFRLGDYRIVYSIDDREKSILIDKVGHRKDVYRERVHEE